MLVDARTYLDNLQSSLYEQPMGLKTGLSCLDNIINGFEPSDLVVVAAATSMGKSSFMTDVLNHVLLEKPAGVFSLEMPRDLLQRRQIANLANVSFMKMVRNNLVAAERKRIQQAFEQLQARKPYWIDDTSRLPVQAMDSKVEAMVKQGAGIIFVDHIHQMPHRDEADVGDIIRELKAINKAYSVPIVALAQLNRNVDYREDHTPRMGDLRSSGQIEQVADKILLLYRPKYYDKERIAKDGAKSVENAFVFVAKNRNGMTGRINVQWDAERMSFQPMGNWHDF